ncbi:MAG: hypothetical protein LBC68_13245 [Prevotellaceae bacterium]|nr:hypothetical protein [Prevotellaceae bacterium]
MKYSVRNYRSVENNIKTYISRGLLTVFHGNDSAPRERHTQRFFYQHIVPTER